MLLQFAQTLQQGLASNNKQSNQELLPGAWEQEALAVKLRSSRLPCHERTIRRVLGTQSFKESTLLRREHCKELDRDRDEGFSISRTMWNKPVKSSRLILCTMKVLHYCSDHHFKGLPETREHPKARPYPST